MAKLPMATGCVKQKQQYLFWDMKVIDVSDRGVIDTTR
jgi:hypothetical protein